MVIPNIKAGSEHESTTQSGGFVILICNLFADKSSKLNTKEA
jgi:hypothetical protein